jgi:DNA-binding protein HU-beta
MTKADIVSEIAKSTGIEKASVLVTVEKFMESVKDSLANGENVYLRGFGSFIVKPRKEKIARNITKRSTVYVPAHCVPSFKPGAEFNKAVHDLKLKKNK